MAEEPDEKNRMLHAGRAKAHSALFTQLRTGKIGFNEFLYERRVPVVWTKRCACDHAAMSVRHILLSCPQWMREREEELGDMTRDLKEVLGTKHGATAAIRLILKTGLLEQFKATAQAKREERRRGAGVRATGRKWPARPSARVPPQVDSVGRKNRVYKYHRQRCLHRPLNHGSRLG